eukprot:scaffold3330_cov101-Skeletonema_dohrnii-CCMP3373.AAC.3
MSSWQFLASGFQSSEESANQTFNITDNGNMEDRDTAIGTLNLQHFHSVPVLISSMAITP